MRATRSGVAIGLALVLLLPGIAAAQDNSEGQLAIDDPVGDTYDLTTEEPNDSPAYMDLTFLGLMSSGDDLVVRFDAAGDIPAEIDPLYTTVGWYLNVDVNGDGDVDRWVALDPLDGWSTSVFDIATVEDTPVGIPVVVDNTLSARIPWSVIGSPDAVRFQGLMQATNFPDPVNDPLTWTEWEDRVPNDENKWLALGQSAGTEAQAASTPSLAALRDVVGGEHPKVALDDVRSAYRTYVESNPEMATTVGVPPEDIDKLMKSCQKEMRKAKKYNGCTNAFANLALAYAQTGDPAILDQLGPFIGATVPAYKGERRRNYVASIRDVPNMLEEFYADLFLE